MELIRDPEWQLAFDFVQYTNRHIFLTGRAGTGKTTFLHALKELMPKRMVVLAPTGVAAINAGGVTIHSFFQLPFGPLVPGADRKEFHGGENSGRDAGAFVKMSREKVRIIRSLDLLVIDEVSMVRADLLDAIDSALRKYRYNSLPFGGVQLLMIGDLQQLAPVIRQEEWELLSTFYDTGFFFGSQALRKTSYISIELTHVFRQSDTSFIDLLNRVRDNQVDQNLLQALNSRVDTSFHPSDQEGYITLTTHNAQAKTLNDNKLDQLKSKEVIFRARIEGDFPEYSYPTEPDLVLKEGAQVMFVKNDPSPEKQFYNGKIGRITGIGEDEILVFCEGDDEEISVVPLEWQNMKYTIDPETHEIEEKQTGSFIQIPLRLAWAITIHKSQGLTFDKVIIDARSAFAHGQVYVALSRCRTLEGLVLSSPVIQPGIINDSSVRQFTDRLSASVPGRDDLRKARKEYEASLLQELFDFRFFQAAIRRCRKLVTEHESIITGNPVKVFTTMESRAEEELKKVADKFAVQLKSLLTVSDDVEGNEALQERVKAAAAYFEERTASIIQLYEGAGAFDSDNRAVYKSLEQEITRLQDQGREKLACLHSCRDGFDVKRFLKARALAAIEPAKTRKKRREELPEGLSPDKNLISAKKSWRDSHSYASGVPVYMVLSVKAIEGISAHQPTDYNTLLKIKGIGKKTVMQYGREILEIVYEHTGRDVAELAEPELYLLEKKGKQLTADGGEERRERRERKPKQVKGDSVRETGRLLREGLSPEEIIRVRKLTQGTVFSHFCSLVRRGELHAEDVIGEEKKEFLEQWFIRHPGIPLKEAKEHLGKEVSYDEMRLVKAGMRGG